MSEARFEQYNNILNNLVAECVACSPESWHAGTLTIDCDGNAINYKLKNDTDENRAELSDELRQYCEELYVVMRQNGDIWVQSVVSYFKKDESWSFKVDFTYDNANAPEITKKPWWKVW